MKKNIILCVIGICILTLICYRFLVILPVESSKHKLTLVNYGSSLSMKNITFKYSVNDEYVKSYNLDLIVAPRYQEPQKYELPLLDNGSVEVIVKCSNDAVFSVCYEDAEELYKTGLLLYTISDFSTTVDVDGIVSYDQYIYFKSGKNQTVFVRKAKTENWVIVDDAPRLKRFTRQWKGYSSVDYGENEWSINIEE